MGWRLLVIAVSLVVGGFAGLMAETAHIPLLLGSLAIGGGIAFFMPAERKGKRKSKRSVNQGQCEPQHTPTFFGRKTSPSEIRAYTMLRLDDGLQDTTSRGLYEEIPLAGTRAQADPENPLPHQFGGGGEFGGAGTGGTWGRPEEAGLASNSVGRDPGDRDELATEGHSAHEVSDHGPGSGFHDSGTGHESDHSSIDTSDSCSGDTYLD